MSLHRAEAADTEPTRRVAAIPSLAERQLLLLGRRIEKVVAVD